MEGGGGLDLPILARHIENGSIQWYNSFQKGVIRKLYLGVGCYFGRIKCSGVLKKFTGGYKHLGHPFNIPQS